jgi:hypothetical protein
MCVRMLPMLGNCVGLLATKNMMDALSDVCSQ